MTIDSINFFEENGYFILENAYSSKECDSIVKFSNQQVDGEDLTPIMNIHNFSKDILLSMSNKKIISFTEKYFCGRADGLQTEFFFMPPNTKGFTPHQDNTFVQAMDKTFMSAWVALTDVNNNNGGLIIWPGTHKEENLLTKDNCPQKNINQDPNARVKSTLVPEKYKAVSPLLKKGSVMMIHSWLVHASNDNLSNANRYVLLSTYIKNGASFRSGNYAKRKSFKLNSYE